MFGAIKSLAIAALVAFILAILMYIFGRIVIADMGLTPPSFQAWFWGSLFVGVPLIWAWVQAKDA